jgi:Protein of unknown function (DUF962)
MGENGDGGPLRSFAAFCRFIYRSMPTGPAGACTSLELRGHFFFEKNRPATFTYPLYSFMADWVKFS